MYVFNVVRLMTASDKVEHLTFHSELVIMPNYLNIRTSMFPCENYI